MSINLKTTLSFAQELAINTGEFIHRSRSDVKITAYKDRQDIVTNIDLEAEKRLITAIKSKFPRHSFYSEEAGTKDLDSDYCWIIDPIDGTKEYLRGLPQYNTCFALEHRGKPVLAVVYRPTDQTLFSAAKNLGAFLNDRPLTLSSQTKLNRSFVCSYLPTYKLSADQADDAWSKLNKLSRRAYRVRGIAEESAALCWVASGSIEATINLGPQPKWHDIIPGMFIALEAGAQVSDIHGDSLKNHHLSHGFVVSNRHIHRQLLNALSL